MSSEACWVKVPFSVEPPKNATLVPITHSFTVDLPKIPKGEGSEDLSASQESRKSEDNDESDDDSDTDAENSPETLSSSSSSSSAAATVTAPVNLLPQYLKNKHPSVVFNCTVMVFSGYEAKHSYHELNAKLKFLVGRKNRSQLFCLGSRYDPSLDGIASENGLEAVVEGVVRPLSQFHGAEEAARDGNQSQQQQQQQQKEEEGGEGKEGEEGQGLAKDQTMDSQSRSETEEKEGYDHVRIRVSDKELWKAAKRGFRQSTQLDLFPPSGDDQDGDDDDNNKTALGDNNDDDDDDEWTKFMEVHYVRPDNLRVSSSSSSIASSLLSSSSSSSSSSLMSASHTPVFVPSLSSGQSQNPSYHTIEYTSAPVVSQKQITVVFVVHARSLGSKLSIGAKALSGLSAASSSLLSPASPSPSPPASSSVSAAPNKCELRLLSLRSLLDYNEKDSDESTFEVSLFGEMFFSMLRRDFGLCILRALENFSRKRSRQVLLSSSLSSTSSSSATASSSSDQSQAATSSLSASDDPSSAEPPAKRAKLEESAEESATTEDSSTTPYEPPSHIVPKTEPVEDEIHIKIGVEASDQEVVNNETEGDAVKETATENEAMEDSLPSPPSPFSPPAISPPQEDTTMHQPVPDTSDSIAAPVIENEKSDQITEPAAPDQTLAPPRVCAFLFPFLSCSLFLIITSFFFSMCRRRRKRAGPSVPEKLSVTFTCVPLSTLTRGATTTCDLRISRRSFSVLVFPSANARSRTSLTR